jgi:murein DD-endopeptidase / murein LD-carboxypeptidase
MSVGDEVVARARGLVGVAFLPQGRDATRGLDCAGVAIGAFGLARHAFKRDYRLRGDHRDELESALLPHFRRVSRCAARPGDLLLFKVRGDQLHMAILTDCGFVHADARLRRVVETPGQAHWPLLAAYRRRIRTQGGS